MSVDKSHHSTDDSANGQQVDAARKNAEQLHAKLHGDSHHPHGKSYTADNTHPAEKIRQASTGTEYSPEAAMKSIAAKMANPEVANMLKATYDNPGTGIQLSAAAERMIAQLTSTKQFLIDDTTTT